MIPRGPLQLSFSARLLLVTWCGCNCSLLPLLLVMEREGRAACAGSLRQFYWPGRRRRLLLPLRFGCACGRARPLLFIRVPFCEVGRCGYPAARPPAAAGELFQSPPVTASPAPPGPRGATRAEHLRTACVRARRRTPPGSDRAAGNLTRARPAPPLSPCVREVSLEPPGDRDLTFGGTLVSRSTSLLPSSGLVRYPAKV
jgi:hypothetical protein